jgi:hypothetical protein
LNNTKKSPTGGVGGLLDILHGMGWWMTCLVHTSFSRSNGTVHVPAHDFNHGYSFFPSITMRPNGTLQGLFCRMPHDHFTAHSFSKMLSHQSTLASDFCTAIGFI